MKRHLRAASLLFNQPLLTTHDMLDLAVRWANQTMSLNIVNLNMGGATANPSMFYDDEDYQAEQDRREEQRRAAIAQTGVEVIPVHGVLVSRGSHLNACETMTSYEGLRAALYTALADPMVEHIVLDIDSPGGSAVGAFELAADIRAATKVKPITGLVNFMAYSGGGCARSCSCSSWRLIGAPTATAALSRMPSGRPAGLYEMRLTNRPGLLKRLQHGKRKRGAQRRKRR